MSNRPNNFVYLFNLPKFNLIGKVDSIKFSPI